MFDSVALPFWLVVVLGIFAAIGIVDRVFAPSVRWFFRRKANIAIEELNTRLQLRIQPFKTTRRQALVDQLLYDPEVIKAAEVYAEEEGVPRAVAMKKAERDAREIVPAFNAYAYSRIGTRIARWISTFVYRVRLGYADDDALSEIDPEATVVFVMNHRSNMDYLLVTYLASASATLSYAVGEWARVWLLQNIIRAMGAYFIRRDSGDKLYRRVLARYVHMATRSGVTQAIFPEGGLSRDGLLREPRFGLLSYMVGGFNPQDDRDVVFVPVGLNYDRVMEDRILTSARDKAVGKRTFDVGIGPAVAFVVNAIRLRMKGQLYSYGYACASFGNPFSLKRWVAENGSGFRGADNQQKFAAVERLGRDLFRCVGAVVPVLPVSVVASVFNDAEGVPLSELELKSRAFSLIRKLEKDGAHIHVARGDLDYAVGTGLRMLTLRHLVIERGGTFQANPGEQVLLDYYANSIAHLSGTSSG